MPNKKKNPKGGGGALKARSKASIEKKGDFSEEEIIEELVVPSPGSTWRWSLRTQGVDKFLSSVARKSGIPVKNAPPSADDIIDVDAMSTNF